MRVYVCVLVEQMCYARTFPCKWKYEKLFAFYFRVETFDCIWVNAYVLYDGRDRYRAFTFFPPVFPSTEDSVILFRHVREKGLYPVTGRPINRYTMWPGFFSLFRHKTSGGSNTNSEKKISENRSPCLILMLIRVRVYINVRSKVGFRRK